MPTYVYQHRTTGEQVERNVPVSERDNCAPDWFRVEVPSRVGAHFNAKDPASADVAAPRGFRQLEQTMPASEIARQTGFSINHIKRVWDM
jgi:hypothetical protein